MVSGGLAVIQSAPIWLPQTMTWLHTQVTSLPDSVDSWVVCDETINMNQFPMRQLVTSENVSIFWRALSTHSWRIQRWRRRRLHEATAARCAAKILHSHFGHRGWENLAVAERMDLRHIVSFYGFDVSRLPFLHQKWRERFLELFEGGDLFLGEGPHLVGRLVALGCPQEKTRVHHLGVPVDLIRYEPRGWERHSPLRVLIAATFLEKKGIPHAIQALGRIRRHLPLEITIVGDSIDQERSRVEKAKILQAISDAGLTSSTILLGFQPYARLMHEAYTHHIFLSPSVTAGDGDTEGGAPVTLLDMAASGMPVIATRHCDIMEILEDGVSGLLADEGDVPGLEACLLRLVDDPTRWRRTTDNARRRIESEFDARIQGHRLGSIYASLTTNNVGMLEANPASQGSPMPPVVG